MKRKACRILTVKATILKTVKCLLIIQLRFKWLGIESSGKHLCYVLKFRDAVQQPVLSSDIESVCFTISHSVRQ
jgi:hypothetical protein